MHERGVWNSAAQKGQEVGYVLGTGTIAWMLLFGPTNPQLMVHFLAAAGTLVIGGELAKNSHKRA